MKAILVNDTRVECNFGCRLTVHYLLQIYREAGVELGHTIPLGAFEPFFHHRDPGQGWKLAWWRRQLAALGHRRLSAGRWSELTGRLAHDLRPLLRGIDLAVVNGEGTLHHDRIATLALLGLVAALQANGIPVHLVNCSLQDIPEFALPTLAGCAYLALREPESHDYCRRLGLDSTLSADCLFLMPAPASSGNPETSRALYSPGVLVRPEMDKVAAYVDSLADFEEVHFLCVNREDFSFLEKCGGIARDVTVTPPFCETSDLLSYVQGFAEVHTARYHLAILAFLLERTLCILPSNTWKMEGLLRHLGYRREDLGKRIIPARRRLAELRDRARLNCPFPALAEARETIPPRHDGGRERSDG